MRALPYLAAALLSTSIAAQPTLLYTSMPTAPYVLDWYMVTDLGSAVIPSDGPAQTWDVTSVTLQYMGTATLADAATTPYASQYPAANWAFDYNLSGTSTHFYNYSQVDATGVQTWANEVPINTEAYLDPKRIVAFPFAYGQSFTDNYQLVAGPVQTVTRSYTGYGTALTPLGTFTDLVKVTSSEGAVELYASDPFYPAVLINSDGSVFVFAPHSTGIMHPTATPQLTIVPGITPGPVRITLPTDNDAHTWRMVDITGRAVRTGPVQDRSILDLDANGLCPGLYRVVLEGDRQQWIGSFVKE